MKNEYIIKVLDKMGNWYDNAFVENSFDAVRICQFYKNELGYYVKLFHNEKDITHLIDSSKLVWVKNND